MHYCTTHYFITGIQDKWWAQAARIPTSSSSLGLKLNSSSSPLCFLVLLPSCLPQVECLNLWAKESQPWTFSPESFMQLINCIWFHSVSLNFALRHNKALRVINNNAKITVLIWSLTRVGFNQSRSHKVLPDVSLSLLKF